MGIQLKMNTTNEPSNIEATRDFFTFKFYSKKQRRSSAGVLEQSMGARNRPGIESCRTGPPGYTGWRNRFLRIGS
jgi:hypothetical protein